MTLLNPVPKHLVIKKKDKYLWEWKGSPKAAYLEGGRMCAGGDVSERRL